MSGIQTSRSAQIHATLSHPVIDSDGHTKEDPAVFLEYLAAIGGPSMVDRYHATAKEMRLGNRHSAEEAREHRVMRSTWYTLPTADMRDCAATALPRLLYERLDEMGLDVSVVYPTIGLMLGSLADDELRAPACRAINRLRADMFHGLTDRLLPVATIPMHTPAEANAELEYAVKELGMKAVMMASYVKRPIAALERQSPGAGAYGFWLDTYGIDSAYDYDPVWAKCVELKLSPTFHSIGWGWGSRNSISNYIHNHLGGFAVSAEAICKGLFFGGIPARFPSLRFGFCEGGVAWARALYCNLIGHWHKRGREGLKRNYDPARIDRPALSELWARYGRDGIDGSAESVVGTYARTPSNVYPFIFDEFEQSGVRTLEDFRRLFIDRFYFGCEGDDPLNALAFNPHGTPLNVRFNALYGSDMGHWDVPRLNALLEEVYELVAEKLATEADLRDFLFVNPVKFWTATNPDFFQGTVVEDRVNALRAAEISLSDGSITHAL